MQAASSAIASVSCACQQAVAAASASAIESNLATASVTVSATGALYLIWPLRLIMLNVQRCMRDRKWQLLAAGMPHSTLV